MTTYAFLVGSNPLLSYAEINAVLSNAAYHRVEKEYVILETPGIEDLQHFMNHLGGTVKIYEIIKSVKRNEILDTCISLLEQRHEGKKLSFALNIYGSSLTKDQKSLTLSLKKALQAQEKTVRFINTSFSNTTSVQSFHEDIVNNGMEIGIFHKNQEYCIGILKAVQDIESYSVRDYGKPERDMHVGLMPPKLAQMMVNLASMQKYQQLKMYDPFCGTGGILIEALLMGYEVLGSDIDEKVLQKALKNIEWSKREFSFIKNEYNLFQHDARGSFEKIENFDSIVTESYLGNPLQHAIDEKEAERKEQEIFNIVVPFFENIEKKVNSHIPLVFSLPIFRTHQKKFFCRKTLAKLHDLGYTASALFSEPFLKACSFEIFDVNSVIYMREDQYVGRQIFRLFKGK